MKLTKSGRNSAACSKSLKPQAGSVDDRSETFVWRRARRSIKRLRCLNKHHSTVAQKDSTDAGKTGIPDGPPRPAFVTTDSIKTFINAGGNVDMKNETGETMLISASCNGDIKAVKLLLDHSAEIQHADQYGNTSLLCALSCSDGLKSVNTLLEAGADPNKKNKCGLIALFEAASGRIVNNEISSAEIISDLLTHGATVNQKNEDGDTVLNYHFTKAKENVSLACIQVLLEGGADVKLTGEFGRTPLHNAVYSQHVGAIQAILERDVSVVNLEDQLGSTALDDAIRLVQNREMNSVSLKSRLEERLQLSKELKNVEEQLGKTSINVKVHGSYDTLGVPDGFIVKGECFHVSPKYQSNYFSNLMNLEDLLRSREDNHTPTAEEISARYRELELVKEFYCLLVSFAQTDPEKRLRNMIEREDASLQNSNQIVEILRENGGRTGTKK